jgi:hypothetical protein
VHDGGFGQSLVGRSEIGSNKKMKMTFLRVPCCIKITFRFKKGDGYCFSIFLKKCFAGRGKGWKKGGYLSNILKKGAFKN